MDRADYVDARKRRYMAQTLESFEEHIEPLIPAGSKAAVDAFKGLVRARFNALSTDAVEIMSLSDAGAINGAAQQMRDSLSPVGRP